MAFTVVYLFMLQSILFMGISEADPLIDVSSSDITMGITSALNINCTFSLNNHPDMAAFISLVLSRTNATGYGFEELAAITEFAPDSAELLTDEMLSATGVHSQTGKSFLYLTWEYPTKLQGGVYQCSAHGMDRIGHNIEITNISLVTVDEANIKDIFEELRQIKVHESLMANIIPTLENQIQVLEKNRSSIEQDIQTIKNDKTSMAKEIQTLQNDKISLELNIQNLERYILHLESTVPLVQKISNWYPLGKHQDHVYYLSTENAGDVDDDIDSCKAVGGELAIMNDQSEYLAIKNFLAYTSGFKVVVIAGTDEGSEGNWVLPNSNTPLPFTAWVSGEPGGGRIYNCLVLDSKYSWLMNTATCHNSPTQGWHYMCELSNA